MAINAHFCTAKYDSMKSLIVLITVLFTSTAFAQTMERSMRRIEVEPSIGIATKSFILCGVEWRYNFNHRPWDVGINTSFDFNGSRVTIVGDYNFLRNKNCSFFIGAGTGWANTSILNINEAIKQYGDSCCASMQDCLCVYPRVGIELFRHLRLTAMVNTYNFKQAELAISLGVAIGGGNKK